MKRKMAPVIVVAVIVVATGLTVAWNRKPAEKPNEVLGSGAIEATEVLVGPKAPGRIVEIRCDEGDAVREGDLVARLDASELDAQIGQAEAAYGAAVARLDAARNGPRPEQIAAARAALAQAEAAEQGARAALVHAERGYARTNDLRAAHDAARMRLKAAEAQLADAREALALVRAGARSQQIDQARAAVTQAEVALRKAELEARRAEELHRDGAVSAQHRDSALAGRDSAAAQLHQAKAALDNLLAGARPEELRRAELGVTQAQANLEAARLAEGSAREALHDRLVASTALDNARSAARTSRARAREARAQLGLLLAGTRAEDLRAAVQQAEQARESLRLARAQRSNMLVYAPSDGVVKARTAEPGEVIGAGSPIVVLVNLSRPWLRVYVPETRYGLVRVGDRADVTVDSHPDRVFRGSVAEISTDAEFTPKNVQSHEERVKLVFGVKIDLSDSAGLLKPGMPADAVIHVTGSSEPAARPGR